MTHLKHQSNILNVLFISPFDYYFCQIKMSPENKSGFFHVCISSLIVAVFNNYSAYSFWKMAIACNREGLAREIASLNSLDYALKQKQIH